MNVDEKKEQLMKVMDELFDIFGKFNEKRNEIQVIKRGLTRNEFDEFVKDVVMKRKLERMGSMANLLEAIDIQKALQIVNSEKGAR